MLRQPRQNQTDSAANAAIFLPAPTDSAPSKGGKPSDLDEALVRSKATEDERSGRPLESDDIALIEVMEREWVLPELARVYDIPFVFDVIERSESPSFTARKCVLLDSAGRRYFLKQKPAYCRAPAQVAHFVAFQEHLSQRTAIVPKIVKTRFGSSTFQVGQRVFFLTPFVEGRYFDGRPEESYQAMNALVEFHRAAQGLPPAAGYSFTPVEDIERLADVVRALPFEHISLRDRILSAILADYESSSSGFHFQLEWLHGDFAPFNLVYRDGLVVAVNDLDNMTYGPRVRDVAECILTHCGVYYLGNSSSLARPIQRYFDFSRAERMLELYHAQSPLPQEEVRALGTFLMLVWYELMVVGLCRGDFSLRDVDEVLAHGRELRQYGDWLGARL